MHSGGKEEEERGGLDLHDDYVIVFLILSLERSWPQGEAAFTRQRGGDQTG